MRAVDLVKDLLKGTSVFLIGMMGAGKTTVGNLLATELGYRFFDTDSLIEKVAGKTIKEIFADDGEESFRELEALVLSDLSAYTKLVVATGGGIVLRQMNWSYLRHGLVIWLDASVEVLVERLQDDTTRPLLQTADPVSALQKLLNRRRNLYAQADLHIQISTNDTPDAIAARIIAEIPTVLKNPKYPLD
ncbi:shikimate kinase [Limnofasciculus baicalensis]|uniref:Shikimate kinase n=1 Tax=Limnofasciculus baicalensis BBK-W-15 TaxID=2699891 RepID=A0AAE3GW30_9CYAN|nr:shikimate kinase [Limnofasciculus baicalensis]MCP2730943.1 shikimate kinase [Limnofasciculus baicalensis BBK-W-15]